MVQGFVGYLKIDVDALRRELEMKLAMDQKQEHRVVSDAAAAETWLKYSMLTAQLSHELCEQLRLVLEPTQTSRLRLVLYHISVSDSI